MGRCQKTKDNESPISPRDHFAGLAMQVLLHDKISELNGVENLDAFIGSISSNAYEVADGMLLERSEAWEDL